jgi:hypothetical protein
MKSQLFAVLAASAITLSPALAAEVATTPLTAGKAAGTRQAALLALGPIFWVGLAAIAVGIGVAASNNGNNTTTPTTTGTGA